MKRVIFALMMMVSSSFAFTFPTYYTSGTNTYKLDSSNASYNRVFCKDSYFTTSFTFGSTKYTNYGNSVNALYRELVNVPDCTGIGNNVGYSENFANYYLETTPTCPAPNTIVNGECVAPDPLECDKLKGTYTNLDGTCTDCSSHLTESTVDGMAQCMCDIVGSQYVPCSVCQEPITVVSDKSTYAGQQIKCSDGSQGYAYYNKKDKTDNNSTNPNDNNTTNPSDGNGTTPNDGNGTKDGNGTAPTTPKDTNGTKDGNGTDGTNYSGVLNSILDKLAKINSGVNDDSSVNPYSNDVPDNPSGGDWNTYQETWGNIIDSVNQVSDKVGEFKGLVQGGFSNPFTKGSTTTCRYTTSFEFGVVGSIPIDFDLCSIVSPVRSIFYTFAYIFFVYAILSFCVKMFLRLV